MSQMLCVYVVIDVPECLSSYKQQRSKGYSQFHLVIKTPVPDEWADALSEAESQFVSEFVAANLDNRHRVEVNVHADLAEFGPAGVNTEQVVQAVQASAESGAPAPAEQ